MHSFIALLAAVLLLVPADANAEPQQVKGSSFVTIMSGNTLLATNRAGVKFKAYFLSGGIASYEDENGVRDQGRWRIRNDEDVCVAWKAIDDGQEHCARVYADNSELTWKGENIFGTGKLLGGVR